MKRRVLFTLLTLFIMAGSLRSQTDVGLSPVALLFGGLKASVEGGLNDH